MWGEVVEVSDSVIPNLDEYEGHEYERVKIKTDSGIDCWIYQYKYDLTHKKKNDALPELFNVYGEMESHKLPIRGV